MDFSNAATPGNSSAQNSVPKVDAAGGYSQIEKDFLGIERLVHYDAAGVRIGMSEMVIDLAGKVKYVLLEGSNGVTTATSANSAPTPDAPAEPSSPPPAEDESIRPLGFGEMLEKYPWQFAIGAFVVAALITSYALTRSQRPEPIGSPVYATEAPTQRSLEYSPPSTPAPQTQEQIPLPQENMGSDQNQPSDPGVNPNNGTTDLGREDQVGDPNTDPNAAPIDPNSPPANGGVKSPVGSPPLEPANPPPVKQDDTDPVPLRDEDTGTNAPK